MLSIDPYVKVIGYTLFFLLYFTYLLQPGRNTRDKNFVFGPNIRKFYVYLIFFLFFLAFLLIGSTLTWSSNLSKEHKWAISVILAVVGSVIFLWILWLYLRR